MRRSWVVGAVSVLLLCLATPGMVWAGDDESNEDLPRLVHESNLQIRATPIGLSHASDTGYRFPLFDSDSDLLDGTHIDAGVATNLSPSYGWIGPYVELLPVAVLNLRASFQAMGYFGTFGYLYLPGDDPEGSDGDWSDEALDRAWDDGLGESAGGWKLELQATPQIMVGPVVATVETDFSHINMGVDDAYYEPFYDLFFEPTDQLVVTRPTVGYLMDMEEGHLLIGARWERAWVRQAEIVRDTAGLVFNWGVPSSLLAWGDPSVAGFGGVFLDHPTRGGVSPYFGMSVNVGF